MGGTFKVLQSGRSRTGQGLNIVGTYKSLIISTMSLKQMDSPLKNQVTVQYVNL